MKLATYNSWVFGPAGPRLPIPNRGSQRLRMHGRPEIDLTVLATFWPLRVLLLTACLAVVFSAHSRADSAGDLDAAQSKRAFWEARARYQAEPRDAEAAWQFGRACFDLADFATNSTERAEIAEQG